MSKSKKHRPPEHDSDYDGAWKEALRLFLGAILANYFPAIAESIDWSYPPEWSDKELSRVFGRAKRRAGRVDVLVKVRLLSGEEQWILLHLEIQSSREANFEFGGEFEHAICHVRRTDRRSQRGS